MVLFNGGATLVLLELALKFVMIPCWPTYFLRHHYPYARVSTATGPVTAEWTANSQGFHDKEQPFRKPPGEFRIVTIGDSFLDGPQQTPLPVQLRREFDDKRINVVNVSRPGIDVNLYYPLFKYALSSYDPDLAVVFLFEGNDYKRMERFSPDAYDKPQAFFRRYPTASWFGRFFPRASLMFSSMWRGIPFVTRWTNTDGYPRWGAPDPVRTLPEMAGVIAADLHVKPQVIEQYLVEKLTSGELRELTTYAVHPDILSYMVGIGIEADSMRILRQRPEIQDAEIARRQVESVFAFLRRMNERAAQAGVEFVVVVIPSSIVDPACHDLYERLGSANDPLFANTRVRQTERLKRLLAGNGIPVFDLRGSLAGIPGTYLKFDTHWSVKGVNVVGQQVRAYLAGHSGKLAGFRRLTER